MTRSLTLLAAAALAATTGAAAGAQGVLGSDAAACTAGHGPAIEATIVGLKDRTGELRLEVYPDNETDFLKGDRDLLAQGKLFRRVQVPTPPSGLTAMCIRVPAPGRYALVFTHNRDGRNKFSFWSDGAGFASNIKIGRSRPKVSQAEIEVGEGIRTATIRVQYLRGLSGFGPLGN
jgi:uncharacterized protein (DUF2141 family)